VPGGAEKLIALRLFLVLCAFCAASGAQADQGMRLLSEATWSLDRDWFGGFSGIEVTAQGTQGTLITDKGMLVRVKMHRRDNRLAGIELRDHRHLTHRNGRPLSGRSHDAEGLALSSDGGTAYVSFEHRHRVTSLTLATGRTHLLPTAPGFDTFEPNAGLEALALHPDGTLYTLPERSTARRAPFELYRLTGTDWHVAHKIPRRGPFLPVGADFDDQGQLYLLDRAVTPLGFRSRIRRFDLTQDTLLETTLLTSPPGRGGLRRSGAELPSRPRSHPNWFSQPHPAH
jgi:hypothetical protein